MLYTADKETGTFIEKVENIDQGMELIQEYEEEDKSDGTYTPNFYDVVNDNHARNQEKKRKKSTQNNDKA